MKCVVIDCVSKQTRIEDIEDVLPIIKTEEELRNEYVNTIISLIRQRYTENDEIAILRKRLANINNQEYELYNTYVEECKRMAKVTVYGGGV